MAWLPAFKYLKGLFARGGEFLLANGEPYEGSYHELYSGETFTGAIPTKNSVQIFRDDSEPHLNPDLLENKLATEQTFPEPEDYDKGFFIRYFIKDVRNGKIVEVKKNTYNEKSNEKTLIQTTVKWILTKPVKDIFNQGYLFKGALTRNKENTLKASLILKNLDKFIVQYDKFVNVESDVKGYKFEELPKEDKRRIILQQSTLRTPPKLYYPHYMYHPKTGEEALVQNEKEHNRYMKLKWVHEKPRFIKKPKIGRFRKKPRIVRPTQQTPTSTNPIGGGGGGGGGGLNSGIYDEITENQEQINLGGSNNNTLSQNNYY